MSMNNAALELALRQAMSRLTAALAGRDAPNSLKLEGLTLAQVTAAILSGTAANATLFDGKTYAQVLQAVTGGSAETLATLEAQFDAFVARQDNPHNVTKAQVGLGNVDNFGTATNADADAKANNKFATPSVVDYMVQKAVDALVGASPETLNTINELAAALKNDPNIIDNLLSQIGTKETPAGAQAKADAAQAAAIAAAAADALVKADQAEADAKAYTDAAIAGVDAILVRADQVEAEAGTDNAKLMTPLRTAQAIAALGDDLFLGKTAQAVDSAKLEGQSLSQVIALAQAGVDMSNVVLKTDDFGQYKVGGQTLTALIAALNAVDASNTSSIAAVQTALNNFIAAKATPAEAVAGTDDVKYITALGLKAAVDTAINGVVDGAPAALDTLRELAAALADQEDAVAALVTVIDTKLNQAQVQAEIATALAPIDTRIDALEAAVGGGSNFMEKGVTDLGTNPVILSSDIGPDTVETFDGLSATSWEPGLNVRSIRTGGSVYTIERDIIGDGTGWVLVTDAEVMDITQIISGVYTAEPSMVDGVQYFYSMTILPGEALEGESLRVVLEGMQADIVEQGTVLNNRITGEVTGLNAAITGVQNTLNAADVALDQRITNLQSSTSAADAALDARIDVLEAAAPTLQTKTGSLDQNTVLVDGSQALLPTVIANLKAYIASVETGADGDLTALQNSFNAFVAAKATGAEVIAGTDDAKYTTSLAVKTAINAAISELAGTAPEALNTINELAAALNNDPNIIGNLMTQIGTKLDATATAVDSAKLGGVVAADYATKLYVDNGLEVLTEGFIQSALELSPNYSGNLTIANLGGGSYGFNASGSINPTLFGTSDTIQQLYWNGTNVTLKISGDQTAKGIDAVIVDGEVLNALVSATFASGSTTFVFTQDHALPNTGTVPVLL